MKNDKEKSGEFLELNLINCLTIIAIIVTFATMSLLIPSAIITAISRSTGHPASPKLICTSRMKQLGLALKQYAMDHKDQFPVANNLDGLNELKTKGYLSDEMLFQCPSGPKDGFSYYYLGGFKEEDSPDISLIFDRPGNHSNYVNVLFLDGHIDGTTIKNYQQPEQVIQQLHEKHKYTPELLERLLKKCEELKK